MIAGILTNNRNVAHMARLLEDHGAEVLDVDYGSKHIAVHFKTKEGVMGSARVSNAPMDPMKLRNYARQSVRRAVARVDHHQAIMDRR